MNFFELGGILTVAEYEHCPRCNGTGRERIWNNEAMDIRICLTCQGQGRYLDETFLLAPESNVYLNFLNRSHH